MMRGMKKRWVKRWVNENVGIAELHDTLVLSLLELRNKLKEGIAYRGRE